MGVPITQLTEDGYDMQFGTNALGTAYTAHLDICKHSPLFRTVVLHRAPDACFVARKRKFHRWTRSYYNHILFRRIFHPATLGHFHRYPGTQKAAYNDPVLPEQIGTVLSGVYV